MRILITGASGAMGRYLAEFIRTRSVECELFGIGRSSSSTVEAYLEYDPIDLLRYPIDTLRGYIGSIKPDIIFHLAAMANVRQSFNDPRRFFANNCDGTLSLLEAIAQSGLKPRFVHCSSSEVYGNVPQALNPIKEHEPHAPVNFYSLTKATQELICKAYASVYGIEFVITRAFGYINPRREDLVATSLARQIVAFKQGKADKIYHGDLAPIRSFCDARDIAEAYWLAGTSCSPGIYNIGSEMPVSIRLLSTMLMCAAGYSSLPMVEQESLRRKTDIFACWPDISKFRRETGWRPTIKLTDSLKWLLECVENGDMK